MQAQGTRRCWAFVPTVTRTSPMARASGDVAGSPNQAVGLFPAAKWAV